MFDSDDWEVNGADLKMWTGTTGSSYKGSEICCPRPLLKTAPGEPIIPSKLVGEKKDCTCGCQLAWR